MHQTLAPCRPSAFLVAALCGVLAGCGREAPAPEDAPAAGPAAAPAAAPAAPAEPPPAPPQEQFWAALSALCGQSYAGYLTIGTEDSDRDIGIEELLMDVRQCSENEIRIPFHVGENRSRTWFVRRTPDGLTLDHRHRDEDGSPHDPTGYGGATRGEGLATRQEFIVNDKTVAMLPATSDNIWALEVIPGELFAYELQRPNQGRHFRVEFPLENPVSDPPPPWGGI